MKVGVVLGYGLYSPERADYKAYLEFIAKQVEEGDFDKVILCGGFTDPEKPDVSEASSMEKYLLSLGGVFSNYILEEKSINTNQNIELASSEIGDNDEVVLFCDSIRLPKAAWAAMHFVLGMPQEEIAQTFLEYAKTGSEPVDVSKPLRFGRLQIVSFDFPGKSKEIMISQMGASMVSAFALYNKEIQDLDEEKRKEIFGL